MNGLEIKSPSNVEYFCESAAATLQRLLCCMIHEVEKTKVSYASKVFKVAFFITGNGHLKFAAYLQNTFVRTGQNGRVV